MKPRIYVDFNTMMMDEEDRVYIAREAREAREGSEKNAQNLLKSLCPGALVVLFDEEMEVEAVVDVVEFGTDHKVWMGRPDWSTRRDLLPL